MCDIVRCWTQARASPRSPALGAATSQPSSLPPTLDQSEGRAPICPARPTRPRPPSGARRARPRSASQEPRDHRRQVGARRLDPLAALARPVEAEEPLLHHVLRLAHAAEHPVGDGERRRAELVELLLGHRSAESLREPLPPARIAELPAELALRLLVRGST